MSLVHVYPSRKSGLGPILDTKRRTRGRKTLPKKHAPAVPVIEPMMPESPKKSLKMQPLLPESPKKSPKMKTALAPKRHSTARKRKRSVKHISAKKTKVGMKPASIESLFPKLCEALSPEEEMKSCTCKNCPCCEDLAQRCWTCKQSGPAGTLLSWRKVQCCEKCGVQYHKACLPAEARVGSSDTWFCSGCAPVMQRANVRWARHKARAKDEIILWKHSVAVDPAVKRLYQVFRKTDGVSGSGAGGAMYGEITQGSMQRVVSFLQQYTGLDETSAFLDLGSGLGKPSAHVAMASPGVNVSCGLELLSHCWGLSIVNLANVLKDEELPESRIGFVCGNATNIGSFNPFTHIYAFDRGWHPMDLRKLSKIFNASNTARTLVSYHKPKEIIFDMGFAVRLLGKISVQMAGSSQSHTAFVYERAADALIPAAPKPVMPPTMAELSANSGALFAPVFANMSQGNAAYADAIVALELNRREQNQGYSMRKRKKRTIVDYF